MSSRTALAALAVALLLAMAPWFTTAALVGPLRAAWQLTPAGEAWLTIAAQIGFVAGALLAALTNLPDLVAPRWLMLAGGLAAAGANATLAACHSFAAAWPWRFVTGACLALVYPPALKLMATWFAPGKGAGRGAALGIMVGALTVGSALPHLVGSAGAADWRTVVWTTSLLTAAGGVWGGLAGAEGPYPFARGRFNWRELALVFRQRGVRLATVGYLGHMWELIAMWSWLGAFLAVRFAGAGMTARPAALATFLVIAAGGVGCWWGGRLSDRGGRERAAGVAMAISAGCALVAGWLPAANRGELGLLLGVCLLWGFWVVADSAQFSVLVTELCDSRYVGTALTAELGLGFSLASVAVWLLPWLLAAGGWGWAFVGLVPGPVIGIGAMARLARARRAEAGTAGAAAEGAKTV